MNIVASIITALLSLLIFFFPKFNRMIALFLFFAALLNIWGNCLKEVDQARYNERLFGTISGEGSYVYLDMLPAEAENDEPRIVIFHQGKYPVYNIGINIFDEDAINEVKSKKSLTVDSVFAHAKATSLPRADPGQAIIAKNWRWDLKGSDEHVFNTQILIGGKNINERIEFVKRNGKWSRKLTVIDAETKNILLKKE